MTSKWGLLGPFWVIGKTHIWHPKVRYYKGFSNFSERWVGAGPLRTDLVSSRRRSSRNFDKRGLNALARGAERTVADLQATASAANLSSIRFSDAMVFRGSGVMGALGLGGEKIQLVAPIETLARFQLLAIIDSLMLAGGWLAGWLAAAC